MKYGISSIHYILWACVVGLLSQCAHKEVKHQLDKIFQTRGQNYARELKAQSPFEKVTLSWTDATKLMLERNPEYRKALTTQSEASANNGLVKNVTHELKRSLSNTATQTLNPKEIAKAINNPVGELPKRLKSLTDLKNVSHSLEQKEWSRIVQAVAAEKTMRTQMVKLHVFFRQEQVIKEQESLLKKYQELVVGRPKLENLLIKKRIACQANRRDWLNSVRQFFNAEYYDVDFKDTNNSLTLYREVNDPQFHQWQRWRALRHSQELATQLSKQHKENKPVVPGMNSIKTSLGIQEFQSNIAATGEKQSGMRNEVRMMLKKWRELKNTQTKIAMLKSKQGDPITPQMIENQFKIYQLLELEIKLVSYFWMLDEECWS